MIACAISFSFVIPATAATLFASDFAGATLDSNLIRTSTGGTLTTGGGTIGTAVFSAGRNYVGTVDTDYATAGFSWTASIEVQHTGFSSNQLFFGLGSGIASSGASAEPQGATAGEAANFFSMQDAGNSRSLIVMSKAFNQGYFGGQQNFSDTQFNTLMGTTGGVAVNAFYRYYLDYDNTTNNLIFSVSTLSGFGGTAGPKVAFYTSSLTGEGFTPTTGRIFFGGDGSSTFDNFSIVPEPSVGMLGVLGLLGLLRRRRSA